MKFKSKMNIKVKWTFNFSIYIDIIYLYNRVAKDIKIQFHTQLFKLYHSTTIKEHAKKKSINQYTNTSITDKIIYKKYFSNIKTKISILIK